MTERPIISVLLFDAEGDPVAGDAIRILEGLAEAGLIDPLWTVDIGHGQRREWQVRHTDPRGRRTCSGLLNDIAGGGPVDIAQVVSLTTESTGSEEAVAVLAEDVKETVTALRLHQPLDARVVDARVAAPIRMDRRSVTVALFSSHADVNLLLIPEDRESDEHFGAPLSLDRPQEYAAHVAAEIASHAGLWTGMEDSPLTRGAAGVIGHGDARVTFARSYARVLIGPPVPLTAAVGNLEHLPVPSTRERAQDPVQGVAEVARQLVGAVPGLWYRQPQSYVPPVETLDTRTTARRVVREAGAYLRSVPRHLRAGVFADLDQLAAEALAGTVGDESTIQVAWTGVATTSEPPTIDSMIRRLRHELARSARLRDASVVTGDGWLDVIATVLGVADGGRFVPGVERPNNRGRLAVIGDVELLTPDPDPDPSVVAASLRDYELPADALEVAYDGDPHDQGEVGARDDEPQLPNEADDEADALAASDEEEEEANSSLEFRIDDSYEELVSSRVLLSELVARVESQAEAADNQLSSAWSALEHARERFRHRDGNDLGLLGWTMGGLTAALVVILILASGAAETLKLHQWNGPVRTSVGLVLAVVALTAAGAAAYAAFRERPKEFGSLRTGLASLVVAAFIAAGGWGQARVAGEDDLFGRMRVQELVLFGTVLVALVMIARSSARLRTDAGDAAARVAGSIALAYLSVGLVGGVVRRTGWYADADPSRRLRLGLAAAAVVLLAMTVVLARISVRRIQERLRLHDQAARLNYEIAVAIDAGRQRTALHAAASQLLGSCTALVRIIRRPFGHVPPVDDARPEAPNDFCAANKAQLQRFDLDQRAFDTLIARIRHQLGHLGWLQAQYETAVEAFRLEMASIYGTNPSDIAESRPEDDPTANDLRSGSSGSLPTGMRWDFVRLLYEGRLDAALRAPLGRLATDELLSGYIDRPGGRIDGSPSSIRDFASPLVSGYPPQLPAYLFERQDLPVGDDERARLSPTLWWPKGAVEPPSIRSFELMPTQVCDMGARGTVLAFVRTDWSMPMALSLLPVAPQRTFSRPVVAESVEPPMM